MTTKKAKDPLLKLLSTDDEIKNMILRPLIREILYEKYPSIVKSATDEANKIIDSISISQQRNLVADAVRRYPLLQLGKVKAHTIRERIEEQKRITTLEKEYEEKEKKYMKDRFGGK